MIGSPANVIPMPTSRDGGASERTARTTVLHAVGDDDGLVEIASVVAALERRACFRQLVINAGEETAVGAPGVTEVHRRLGIGRGSHAERTAEMLVGFERVLLEQRPEIVLVTGDDDAALAAALAAAKLDIAVGHIGAGLRSWDWTLPEEVNRSVIDRLSDTLFTPSTDAGTHLLEEGIPDGRIHRVGNTRIDMLRRYEAHARTRAAWRDHGVDERDYTLVALQRPASIAPADRLERIARHLEEVARDSTVLLLVHPRTREVLESVSARLAAAGVRQASAAGYLDALSLEAGAGAIVTDAGAVQDEASALGVPCYTLQPTTARTVTLTHGTNVLLGDDPAALESVRPTGWAPTPAAIPLWDGRAGERIAEALVANYTLAVAFAEDR
jgi:UDP-N-acetylglucosamine 2-epimerase (non-hydrolysing)